MAKTYEPIASTTLSSDTATYTLSSIPATYTDLILVVVGESTRTDNARGCRLRFNGDTGNNYSNTYLLGDGSSASSARQSSIAFVEGFALSRTNYGDAVNIGMIQSYSNTNVYKTALLSLAYPAGAVQRTVNLWRDTSAISSIEVYVGLNAMKAGTTISLYGIKAA